jgi:MFS family permease
VGGAVGGTVLGVLTQRFDVKPLTITVLMASALSVAMFGRTPPDLQQLSIICAIAGFCTNAGIVGLYAIIAEVFPTHVRASGTGFAIGTGRGGSVLAPIIAGFLFAGGFTLPTVALMLALGSLCGAAVLLLLRLETDRSALEFATRRRSSATLPAPTHAR